jgi:hypothetical protein
MANDAEQELPKRFRAAALIEAEYQKTETARKIKLAEADEYGAAEADTDKRTEDQPE